MVKFTPNEGRRAITEPTPAELKTLSLAAQGLSYREIGERVFVTPEAVKNRLQSLCNKMGIRKCANPTTAAVAKAYQRGLLQ